jgi:hypothetical protein
MYVCMVISLLKIPYIYTIYTYVCMVLVNPRYNALSGKSRSEYLRVTEKSNLIRRTKQRPRCNA